MNAFAEAAGVLEGLPEPWVLLRPVRDDTGAVVDFVYAEANLAACAFNGTTHDELVGMSLICKHPNAVASGLLDSYRHIIESGEPMVLLDWGYSQDVLDGEWRYYDVRAYLADGCVSQTWIDVTDRHTAVEQLKASENRYRVLAQEANEVVFRGSNAGVIEWVSEQTASILGLTPDEVIGRPFLDLVHPDDSDRVRAWQAQLLAGVETGGPVRLRGAGGIDCWVVVSVKPVFDEAHNVVGRVGHWADINDIVRSREAAEASRVQARAILDAQLDPFVLLTAVRDESGSLRDLEYAEANEAALTYDRTTREALVGRHVLDLYPGQLEHGPMLEYFHAVETGEPVVLDDYAYPNEVLGQERRYDIRAVRCGDGIALTWRDVTDRHRAAEALALSEHRYHLLAQNATDVIWQVDREGNLVWVSESTPLLLGWTSEEVIGTQSTTFVHPDDYRDAIGLRTRARAGLEGHAELRFRCQDGSYRWMAATVKPLEADADVGRIVALRDIDAEVHARDALTQSLGRDRLTGLMARAEFERAITKAAQRSRMQELAVLCIGLDSLSVINNAYTHVVGDVVLTTTAARIVAEGVEAKRLARGDGAVFFVLLPDDPAGATAADVAERVRQAVKQPIKVGTHIIATTVSQGIAVGVAGIDAAELIRAATVAMRAAKAAGRDRIQFATQALAADAERLATLTGVIADGLQRGEFTCWFQPIADLVDEQVLGYEALARWTKPDGSVVQPEGFMAILEHSSLVSELDAVVLAECLKTLASLPAPIFISVNVSPRSLASPEHTAWMIELIQRSGIDPTRLHLEVTETALLAGTSSLVERMRAIADLGVRWYVDDFGTGYSSISHLRDLPVRGLKLDVSFTHGVGSGDVPSTQLAQALAGLGLALGLDTVAEGVETAAQRASLATQGWRRGQGWLFGHAEPMAIG